MPAHPLSINPFILPASEQRRGIGLMAPVACCLLPGCAPADADVAPRHGIVTFSAFFAFSKFRSARRLFKRRAVRPTLLQLATLFQ